MENSALFTSLLDIFKSHTTISLKNVSYHLNMDLECILPVINEMQIEGLVRIARPKSCTSGCSSCSSCHDETSTKYTGDEIVISHISIKEPLDGDE